jgi:hypothetical protein
MERRSRAGGVACIAGVLVVVVSWAAPVRADGPPFDHARGAADRFTGLIGGAMARTGIPREIGQPSVEARVYGLVGDHGHTGPGLAHAWARVDVLQATVDDPWAAVCIQIAGEGLPSNPEGGGPVCEFLSGHPLGSRTSFAVRLDVYAESSIARDIDADVFVSSLTVPAETGSTFSAVRVTEISLDGA